MNSLSSVKIIDGKAAAARVRGSMGAEFRPMGADEIMRFIRGDEPAPAPRAARNIDRHFERLPIVQM